MTSQRIGNYDAFNEYQRAVFDRTENQLATMDPADFERVIRHMGEIELTRGFLGLGGMTA